MKYIFILLIIASFTVAGFSLLNKKSRLPGNEVKPVAVMGISYLPLGDSYTIGQSVDPEQRWPNQLVEQLKLDGVTLGIVANPSVTGYTSQDLIDRELPLLKTGKPEFVTIQIGVNDWVQGVPAATFQKNLRYIIDQVQAALPVKTKVLLVTIPDYGLTPTGSRFGTPAESHNGVMAFNKIIQDEGSARGLAVADIFPASQQVANDPSLTAKDGLHPSGKQYSEWVKVIKPLASQILK